MIRSDLPCDELASRQRRKQPAGVALLQLPQSFDGGTMPEVAVLSFVSLFNELDIPANGAKPPESGCARLRACAIPPGSVELRGGNYPPPQDRRKQD